MSMIKINAFTVYGLGL